MRDNAGKKRIGFNVFDVFIILLVVILIATVGYKIYQTTSKEARKDNPTCTVVFECDSEYDSLGGYLKNGDAVYLKSTGQLLGYMYASSTNDVVQIVSKNDKEDVQTDKEDASELPGEKNVEIGAVYSRVKYTGKLRLNGNAEKSREGAFYILEGMNITVGSEIEVYTDNAEFTIVVKELIDKNS
ncbi:MAG: DUF4330 family protein [Ruminococcaceae bacterium]|nr:DUF4330 family protein [Oscillospiraceae bacterium]